jgi:hypothetical protein
MGDFDLRNSNGTRIRLPEKEFANPGQPPIRLTIHDVAEGTLGDQARTPSLWKVRLSLVP